MTSNEIIIYSTIKIANSFIQKGLEEEQYFNVLQIHRLIYFFYGYGIGIGAEFKIDEVPVTKETGPMFEELLVESGDTNKTPISELLGDKKCAKFCEEPPHDHQLLFDYVYNKYSHMSGKEMSEITQAIGTPWSETKIEKGLDEEIPQDLIHEHFNELFIKELEEYNQENGGS